jgi:hypothetical protein
MTLKSWRRTLAVTGLVLFALNSAMAQTTDHLQFSFGENSGMVLTPISGTTLTTGYVTVQATDPSPPPAMTEIAGYRPASILTTETVFGSAPLVTSGRLYVQLTAQAFTGADFVNHSGQSVQVSFYFTDKDGNAGTSGSFGLSANTALESFFNQPPFSNAPSSGTLTFTATGPIAVQGLRAFFNERGDFLITPVPLVPLTSSSGAVTIPNWADGGGFSNRVVVINSTDLAISGTITFLTSAGTAATLTVNGTTGSSFPYSIAAKSLGEFVTSGGMTIQTGSIRIAPGGGSSSPAAFSIMSYKPSTITQSEGMVPGLTGVAASRTYVENGTNLVSGVAVANPSPDPVDATFTLTNLSGTSLGSPAVVQIPANGQTAHFLTDLFPNLPGGLQGILRVSTSAMSGVVTIGIRFRTNERSEALLSGIPAIPEGGTPDTVLPQFAVGTGYLSQVALFGRTPGATNAGTVNFISSAGSPLSVLSSVKKLKAQTTTN